MLLDREIIVTPYKTNRPFIDLLGIFHSDDKFNLMRFFTFPCEMNDASSRKYRSPKITRLDSLLEEAQHIKYGAFAGRVGTNEEV